MKRTVVDCPGCRVTLSNPFSWRGGSLAAAGSPRYSCATSEPATLPVLVTVAETVTWRLPWPSHRQDVGPGLELAFCTCWGVTCRWLNEKFVYDRP